MIVRLVLACFVGFFFAAFTAGIIEASGNEKVEFGTFYATLLIMVWTYLIWQLLSRKGPLRAG